MKMKICAFSVLVSALLIAPGIVNASTNVPVWNTGDWWKYNFSIYTNNGPGSYMRSNGIIYHNMTGIEDVDIGGNTYTTYTLKILARGNVTMRQTGMPMPMTGTFAIDGKNYVDSDTLSKAMSNQTTTIYVMGSPMMKRYDDVMFNPPNKGYDFPLDAGEVWWSNGTVVYKWAMTYMFTIQSDSGVANTKMKYSCRWHGDYNVPKGTFDSYIINGTETSKTGNSTETIYSPDVKNFISRNETIQNNATSFTIISYRLLDYGITAVDEGSMVSAIIMATCIIASTWVWTILRGVKEHRYKRLHP